MYLEPGDPLWLDAWIPRDDPLWRVDVSAAAGWVGQWWRRRARPARGMRGLEVHAGRAVPGAARASSSASPAAGRARCSSGGRKVVGLSQWRRPRRARCSRPAHTCTGIPQPLLGLLEWARRDRGGAGAWRWRSARRRAWPTLEPGRGRPRRLARATAGVRSLPSRDGPGPRLRRARPRSGLGSLAHSAPPPCRSARSPLRRVCPSWPTLSVSVSFPGGRPWAPRPRADASGRGRDLSVAFGLHMAPWCCVVEEKGVKWSEMV